MLLLQADVNSDLGILMLSRPGPARPGAGRGGPGPGGPGRAFRKMSERASPTGRESRDCPIAAGGAVEWLPLGPAVQRMLAGLCDVVQVDAAELAQGARP